MESASSAGDRPRQSDFSRPVTSNQTGVHPQLPAAVQRHLQQPLRRPLASYSASAFARLRAALAEQPRPLVMDSFCGTGMSTAMLAARHPEHLVVGVDQSAHRLGKHVAAGAANYLLLQAKVEDIWALMLAEGLALDHHYLLYPNPWPKGKHLQRRVHGHGSFPLLLALGGGIELRSNWQLYVEEFGVAMHLAGRHGWVSRIQGDPAITLFEAKYRDSGHPLWAYTSPP